jgi:hypothetical protein
MSSSTVLFMQFQAVELFVQSDALMAAVWPFWLVPVKYPGGPAAFEDGLGLEDEGGLGLEGEGELEALF